MEGGAGGEEEGRKEGMKAGREKDSRITAAASAAAMAIERRLAPRAPRTMLIGRNVGITQYSRVHKELTQVLMS